MNLEILKEIGEWAAVGFYEGQDLPFPRAYGLAMRRMYEHMDVRVPDGRLIIPCESLFEGRNMRTHGVHHVLAYILNFFHHSGLEVQSPIADEKKQRFPQHAEFIDSLADDLRTKISHFGGYTHSNPDTRRVVGEGFAAMEAELDDELRGARGEGGEGGEQLLLALKDYCAGVRALYDRTCTALREAARAASGERKAELELIAGSFAKCFMEPSTTFLQGVLALNFTWMLDGCDSIGRVDQVLGTLFEHDVEAGTLDIAFARRLLDECFQLFEEMNGWNLQIGGRRPDGTDGCNALTRELVLACGRNHIRRPNVAFRITANTPDNLLVEALEVLREGSGRPALYNDDLYVKALLDADLGLTAEDAREIGFGGCTETMIGGLSNVGSLEGEISLAKALELAMNNGMDPVTGNQVGPETGTFVQFATFAQFADAVREQIRVMTQRFAEGANAALTRRMAGEEDPKLYRTFFTRDCVKRRLSFEEGGARYNWSVVTYQGIANLIDSLAAVKHCVFDEQQISSAELTAALAADFAGHDITLRMLKAAPKFGNDDAYVDDLAREVIGYAWRQLRSYRQVRGGRFLPSCIVFATYARAGQPVGATPDGRLAGTPLNDSVGAVAGRDCYGPTALLNSVIKLPLDLATGTPVLNLRFQKETLADRQGLDGLVGLLRSFFERGGMQAQISVISKEEMLAAQETPEDYRDLLVRIGGYSEYFVRLDKALQDSVIARTEYGLGQ